MRVFTKDPQIIAAGSARFPVMMGIVSMWGISVPLSYLFGITFGWGLLGMWAAFAIDEWLRGILMYCRWKSKAWESKALVHPIHEPVSE